MTTLGKYELHDELGRGGFAVVYRALDTRLNREVALKVLNASLSEDPRFVEQFRREPQTAANLKHPNIVVIHEADESGGRLYLAMELLPGLDLRRRIERDGPLPFPLVVSVIEQIAAALAYAHGRGLIHRDVKAANIILDENGHATLTDFGLVRAVEGSTYGSSLSLSGGFAGTVEYMSPEQADGQTATAKSDLYALAIVAYEMVTGRVPFKADTPLAVIRMQADKPAPDPSWLRPDLPGGMRVTILKALAKKPDERQANVAAFSLELRAGLEGKAPHAAHKANGTSAIRTLLWFLLETEGERAARVARQEKAARQHADKERSADAIAQRGWGAGIGLGAAALLILVLGAAVILMINLNPSRSLAATQAALISSFATASAAAATVVPSTPAVPSPTPALGIGSTQVSPVDGMVLLYVPAGNFIMGSADTDPNAQPDEKPQHTVYVDAFWIDRTDVTNAMYARCVAARACQAPNDKNSVGHSSYYDNPTYADYPVINMSWGDANIYCGWAGRHLPSEAEWEKAARGTDGRLYPWGNQAPNEILLNYNQKIGDTTAVSKYLQGATPYGALDMAGNVWQWVADWYGADYYLQSPKTNPKGPATGQDRVLRGGSWVSEAQYVRAAKRFGNDSGFRFVVSVGFRCAR